MLGQDPAHANGHARKLWTTLCRATGQNRSAQYRCGAVSTWSHLGRSFSICDHFPAIYDQCWHWLQHLHSRAPTGRAGAGQCVWPQGPAHGVTSVDMRDAMPRIWPVGALCRAVADTLNTRFNPVAVRGEISGLARASSGHCYFSLKDQTGQIRCVMFKRALGLLDFSPRDGELVELEGRLGLYEPRGDLQLIVDTMSRSGPGALFEQFLILKAKLDAEGLFESSRKKAIPRMPRGIGVVTSLGAAALHDVVSALQRRVPHIPVVIAPALVQGTNAPAELSCALTSLYDLAAPHVERTRSAARSTPSQWSARVAIDVILLVRGGGSMEDLAAFNDESLARVICQSPVPIISGIGHETDFTIADFVADLRAPTPTSAAELTAQPRALSLDWLDVCRQRLSATLSRRLDNQAQRLDLIMSRIGRPSGLIARQEQRLQHLMQLLRHAQGNAVTVTRIILERLFERKLNGTKTTLQGHEDKLFKAGLRLRLLDPNLVLNRGYAWVSDAKGHVVTRAGDLVLGQPLRIHLAHGLAGVAVTDVREEWPH